MNRQEETGRWYTRRDGVVRGPFPVGDITRYILLGRIRLDDELSRDTTSWSPARTLTGLLPHEMLNLNSWEDYQRYIEARMHADERRAERRRDTCPECAGVSHERRVLRDRRRGEDPATSDRFVFGFQGLDTRNRAHPFRFRTLMLTLVLAMLVFAWLVPVSR